ncbi:hypothetical protein COCNU_scaffold000558G000040 [Cocos nucifera]|nr:hypothetical protein [Cocos nucifera]
MGHLSPIDRRALDGEGAYHQMADAFRSLALVSHYLVNFAGISSKSSSLKLIEVKEELERFKYYLEQEKTANADLIKEINCSKKALFEAQEKIDHRYDKLSRAHQRIEVLERQRFTSASDIIMGTNKDNSAMQTEEVEVGESLSRMDRKDLSPSKALDLKSFQRKKVNTTSDKSTRARVELILVPPTSETEEFNPHNIEDFQVVRALHDSDPPTPEGSHGIPILLSEIILSLPAPDVFDFFPKEGPTKETGAFKTAMDGV